MTLRSPGLVIQALSGVRLAVAFKKKIEALSVIAYFSSFIHDLWGVF